MRQDRNFLFRRTLIAVLAASAVLIGFLLLFGKTLAAVSIYLLLVPVFLFFAAAVFGYLAISFLPLFRNDRRWYAIPVILTVIFFIGAALLWRCAPVAMGGSS